MYFVFSLSNELDSSTFHCVCMFIELTNLTYFQCEKLNSNPFVRWSFIISAAMVNLHNAVNDFFARHFPTLISKLFSSYVFHMRFIYFFIFCKFVHVSCRLINIFWMCSVEHVNCGSSGNNLLSIKLYMWTIIVRCVYIPRALFLYRGKPPYNII